MPVGLANGGSADSASDALLKIQSLSYGNSGVQLATVQRLIDFYNADILPVVFSQGSLGASGDLAPLANLSLPLLGLGEVMWHGHIIPASEALDNMGWRPIELQSKEGSPCSTALSSCRPTVYGRLLVPNDLPKWHN